MAYDQKDYGYVQGGLADAATYGRMSEGGPEVGPFSVAAMAFDDARGLANRISALADRLCGSVPTPVSNANGIPSSQPPLLTALRIGSEQTRDAIRDAHQALERIERSLS